MGSNQENLTFTDPETGEVFTLNTSSLVSNVRDILLSRRKMQTEATVWSKLKEAEQKDEITAMQELARDLVGKVAERVAERGLTCANVAVSKFAVDVDKGMVTITSAGYATDEMLTDLAHAKGKVARLTVIDEGQFNAKSTQVKPDKDQPPLFGDDADEKPDAPVEGAIADQLREAGYDVKEDADGNQEIEAPADAEAEAEVDQEAADAETPENKGDAVEEAPNDQEPIKSDEPEITSEPEGENGQMSPDDAADAQEAAPEPDKVDPYEAGQQARVEGLGPDDNPHDGGTEDGTAWAEGYTDADGEIDQLIEQGYEARKDGLAPERNPWKAKSRENGWWQQGYDKAKAEGLPEE